jgi:hypothetical protein
MLEAHYALNVNLDAHIWLIHHLFLPSINRDAQQWTETWNNHTLARRGDAHRTPANMYVYGMVNNGTRGIQVAPEDPADITDDPLAGETDANYAGYGIDWDDLDIQRIQDHHNQSNVEEGDPINPFLTNQPDRLSHVEVREPRCPFEHHQVQSLDTQLDTLPHRHHTDMQSRRLLWIDSLHIASGML